MHHRFRSRFRTFPGNGTLPILTTSGFGPGWTFSRAATATGVRSSLITSYAANVLRLTDFGALWEGGRTNNKVQSNIFNAGTGLWTAIQGGTGTAPSILSDANYGLIAAPDGSFTATRLQLNKGAGATGGDFSGYSRTSAGGNTIWVRAVSAADNLQISTGVSVPTAVNTTWQRVFANQTTNRILALGNIGSNPTSDILVWQDQEEGNVPFASSNIYTTTAAIARDRDVGATTLSGAGLPTTGFTVMGRCNMLAASPTGIDQVLLQADAGADTNCYDLRVAAAGAAVTAGRVTASVRADATNLGNMTPGTSFPWIAAFDVANNTIRALIGGGSEQSVAGGPSGMTNLRLGGKVAAGSDMFGYFTNQAGNNPNVVALGYAAPAGTLAATLAASGV